MNISRTYFITGILIVAGLFLSSCHKQKQENLIIVTRVPVTASVSGDADLIAAPDGSALVALHPDGKGEPEVLTAGFMAACSPHVSYDGRHILFSGKKEKDGLWQIWEMDLKNKKSRQITHCKGSCHTPYYLPGGRLVFSREMPDTGTGSFWALFTLTLEGKNLRQITYHPSRDLIATILRDGRILMHSRRVFPDTGKARMLALRPNGTKMELFYEGGAGAITGLRMTETPEGILWFTERSPAGKWNIARITYNRPLHSEKICTEKIPGAFYAVVPYDSGRLVVSFREPAGDHTVLALFSPGDMQLQKTFLSDKEYNYLDPVIARPYERPKNLPDELMCSYPTGLLMSQNVNFTGDSVLPDNRKAVSVEILGMDKSLGIVPVEKDGSFFLKIPANMPFRLQTLDKDKHVVLGPSAWLWLRPFERRGCIGCHENPELAPENVVPMAVNYFPVVIPVDTTKELKRGETFHLGKMH